MTFEDAVALAREIRDYGNGWYVTGIHATQGVGPDSTSRNPRPPYIAFGVWIEKQFDLIETPPRAESLTRIIVTSRKSWEMKRAHVDHYEFLMKLTGEEEDNHEQ